jgi:hypothetical protein
MRARKASGSNPHTEATTKQFIADDMFRAGFAKTCSRCLSIAGALSMWIRSFPVCAPRDMYSKAARKLLMENTCDGSGRSAPWATALHTSRSTFRARKGYSSISTSKWAVEYVKPRKKGAREMAACSY